MKERAVIDRFEADKGVLLLRDGMKQAVVPRTSLPPLAKEGDCLQVEFDGTNLVAATLDSEETLQARKRVEDKRARLRRGEHLRSTRPDGPKHR